MRGKVVELKEEEAVETRRGKGIGSESDSRWVEPSGRVFQPPWTSFAMPPDSHSQVCPAQASSASPLGFQKFRTCKGLKVLDLDQPQPIVLPPKVRIVCLCRCSVGMQPRPRLVEP